jgi:hypothetical protein
VQLALELADTATAHDRERDHVAVTLDASHKFRAKCPELLDSGAVRFQGGSFLSIRFVSSLYRRVLILKSV